MNAVGRNSGVGKKITAKAPRTPRAAKVERRGARTRLRAIVTAFWRLFSPLIHPWCPRRLGGSLRPAPLTFVVLASILAPAVCARAWDPFRSENGDVARGNEHMRKGQLDEALESYETAARALPREAGVQLDRGLALMAKGKLDEARQAFQNATQGSASADVRAAAHDAMGLAFMAQADAASSKNDLETAQKYLRESVDAFKSSLRAKPGNREVAWNLELARRRLVDVEKKREEQKKKDEEQKKQEEEQKKEDQQQDQGDAGTPEQPKDDEQNQDEQQKNEQKKDGEDEAQNEPKQGDDTKQPKQDESKKDDQASPQDAQQPHAQQKAPKPNEAGEPRNQAQPRMPEHMQKALQALEADEQNLEKYRAQMRARQRPRRVEKDW